MAFALLALTACETFREVPDSDNYIFLEPGETLYVRLTFSPNPELEQRYPDMADSMKDRRYDQYFESMRRLLQLYRFPMDVVLLEEMESPGAGPLLDLFALRWEQDKLGDITTVLRARLERYGDVNTLGVFRKREAPSMMSSYERTEQVFARTMEDALSQMFVELNNHFETPAEEIFVDEGSEP